MSVWIEQRSKGRVIFYSASHSPRLTSIIYRGWRNRSSQTDRSPRNTQTSMHLGRFMGFYIKRGGERPNPVDKSEATTDICVAKTKNQDSRRSSATAPGGTTLTLFLLKETFDCSLLGRPCKSVDPELRPKEISRKRNAFLPDWAPRLEPGVTMFPSMWQAMRKNTGTNGWRVRNWRFKRGARTNYAVLRDEMTNPLFWWAPYKTVMLWGPRCEVHYAQWSHTT